MSGLESVRALERAPLSRKLRYTAPARSTARVSLWPHVLDMPVVARLTPEPGFYVAYDCSRCSSSCGSWDAWVRAAIAA